MDKRSKLILALFALVLITITVSEIVRPRPLDWRPNYTASGKMPYGCYIVYNELTELFPKGVRKVDQSVFESFLDEKIQGGANYFMVNNYLYLDEQETNKLLDFVAEGNDVFIASTGMGYPLQDTLNLSLEAAYHFREDTISLKLTHKNYRNRSHEYYRGIYKNYFASVDSVNTTILGTISYYEYDNITQEKTNYVSKPNFIKTKFGKGHFYLHSTPQTFTNYYLKNGHEDYIKSVLSYLRNKPIYWDNYKKAGRVVIESPLRFILAQPALRWAYYIAIFSLILFILFKAKREQRIIPVWPENENSSINFAQTVGSLYYQRKNYSDIIEKKINYFQAYLRSRYYLNSGEFDIKTAQQLARKSGKNIEEAQALIDHLIWQKNKTNHSAEDLIQLNKKISAFK